MNYWFTSDTHFDHKNICRYSNRPFNNTDDMNETLINNWNSVVAYNDIVYFLGDFCFGNEKRIAELLRRLKGNIYIIFGNHDKALRKFAVKDLNANKDLVKRIKFLGDYSEININGQHIVLCHYGLLTWNRKSHNSWMLCGHSHSNLSVLNKNSQIIGKILDVGCDGNNYRPYSYDDIKDIIDKKPMLPDLPEFNDHHGVIKDNEV
jgi:calcineurin-like phosphoesterase family protein